MISLSPEQINDISQEIDMGQICFINKLSSELIFTPDFDRNAFAEEEFYEDDIKLIKKNPHDYLIIQPLVSYELFKIMKGFISQLDNNNKLKEKLADSLIGRNSFRCFKEFIDYSDYRHSWFDFKQKKWKNMWNALLINLIAYMKMMS
ncbi:hypothetical protein BH10BAC5_BH10BAC5_05470 [soil metagenome]